MKINKQDIKKHVQKFGRWLVTPEWAKTFAIASVCAVGGIAYGCWDTCKQIVAGDLTEELIKEIASYKW